MGLIRLVVMGFVVLSVIYFSLWLYFRSLRRENLEEEWDEENPGGARDDRDAYVEKGMEKYEQGFRSKLIFLVYIVPPVIITTILYLTNAN